MNITYINERKRSLGLTNAKIAEKTGITLSTLDKITSGANSNPKLDTLIALANVLHCTLDAFLERNNPEEYSREEAQIVSDFRSLDERSKLVVKDVLAYAVEMTKRGVAMGHRRDPTQAELESRVVYPGDDLDSNAAGE